MGTLALIGLGSNLGDRRAILDGAVASLRATPGIEVRAVSTYHETAPVGGPPGQGPFLNAVARLMCSLAAEDLHRRLLEIEREAGRVRAVRWGERTLDLDLLMYDALIRDSPALTLPHPRMAVRRFALAPAAEVAPEAIDTLTARSIGSLLANLDRRPSLVSFFGLDRDSVASAIRALAARLPSILIQGRPAASLDVAIEGRPEWLGRMADNAELLDAKRLVESGTDGTWLLADFCPDLEDRLIPITRRAYPPGTAYADDPTRRNAQEQGRRQLAAREAALPPTFVVVLADAGAIVPRGPRACRSPILWMTSSDPEEIAREVHAACLATRPG